jgi:ethanolamine utilization protein EutA
MNMPIENTTLSEAVHADKSIYLLGLDFGSTTSSALVAKSELSRSTTGHMQFDNIKIVFRSAPVFTPFVQENIDIAKVSQLLNDWLTQSGVHRFFSGGSIITGLAAQTHNAVALRALITETIGDSVIATADDPCLESWLSFMGSSAALSRYHATESILNLDIGGGTTNAAIGINGDVQATGCYFIGARHFQFVSGGYQLVAISSYGAALLKYLNLAKKVGDTLSENECAQIIAFYIATLEAIAVNNTEFFSKSITKTHQQVPLVNLQNELPKITFSGGVGELIYQYTSGLKLPETTYFGDFGIDLAHAIVNSKMLSANLTTHVPENQGRATVYGLTLHNTEVSGQTLFLPNENALPLSDLPIIAKLSLNMPMEQWKRAFALAASLQHGSCIHIVDFAKPKLKDIRNLAKSIKTHYSNSHYPNEHPLVILVEANIGKALGQYCSDWGKHMQNLIVIDEVPLRHAQFVHIGRLYQQILPVSFFGMHNKETN